MLQKEVWMNKGVFPKTLAFVIAMSFFIAGCDNIKSLFNKSAPPKKVEPVAKPQGTIIATVGSAYITLEELDRYVEAYNEQIENYREIYPDQDIGLEKAETLDQKIDLLKNDLIRQKLIYQEAIDRGLDKKEDVETALKEFRMNLLVASLVSEVVDDVDVSSGEIEDYYNTNKELMRGMEERHVLEIVTVSESQANNALIEVLQGTDFTDVARSYSISTTASKGGDLGFIMPGTKFPQFDIAVYSLDLGRTSTVIKNPDANEYYIVKVQAIRGGETKPLSELWDDIELMLEQTKQKEAIDNLVSKLWRQIKVDIKTSEIR
ncbi:MAG TPA: hypothetical protein ENH41_01765 [Candidatus Omnitrophica bacterium]|nr:hypothetical protein [Candidatus Omnitrophota bacterium]